LIIIGAINWGLVGFFDFNLVAALFGADTFLTNLIYDLVGISAIAHIILNYAVCRTPTRSYAS